MNIQLTNEQVLEMARLAILASNPVGLGFLHYKGDLKKEDIKVEVVGDRIDIDYYDGRMVKFHAFKTNPSYWGFNDTISYDYQSWKSRYDSYLELAKVVMNNDHL